VFWPWCLTVNMYDGRRMVLTSDNSTNEILGVAAFRTSERKRNTPAAMAAGALRNDASEHTAAALRKSSPQALVTLERLSDRSLLRLAGFHGGRKDVLEAVVINTGEELTQDRGGEFIRPQNSGA